MWNLKYDTNEHVYETDSQMRKQTCGSQVEQGGEGQTRLGVGRCKLLHLECINNKGLLYTTRNYIQSPEINYNGKEYFKKGKYVCVKLSHFAVQQTLTHTVKEYCKVKK